MAASHTLVRQHFEREARLWREIYQSDAVEAAVYRTRQNKLLEIVDRISLERNAPVLEIGCGAGWNVAALAQRGFRVHAIDLVPEMLATTREVAAEREVGCRVTTSCANAERLPFGDESFDLVVGIALLEWAHSPMVFHEISRVLRIGGAAVLTATNRWSLQRCLDPQFNPGLEPLKERLRGGGRAHARTHSTGEIIQDFASAGLVWEEAVTAGFGPFTLLKRKLLPGARGAKLHDWLQRRADRSARGALQRLGYAHIVKAVKV